MNKQNIDNNSGINANVNNGIQQQIGTQHNYYEKTKENTSEFAIIFKYDDGFGNLFNLNEVIEKIENFIYHSQDDEQIYIKIQTDFEKEIVKLEVKEYILDFIRKFKQEFRDNNKKIPRSKIINLIPYFDSIKYFNTNNTLNDFTNKTKKLFRVFIDFTLNKGCYGIFDNWDELDWYYTMEKYEDEYRANFTIENNSNNKMYVPSNPFLFLKDLISEHEYILENCQMCRYEREQVQQSLKNFQIFLILLDNIIIRNNFISNMRMSKELLNSLSHEINMFQYDIFKYFLKFFEPEDFDRYYNEIIYD